MRYPLCLSKRANISNVTLSFFKDLWEQLLVERQMSITSPARNLSVNIKTLRQFIPFVPITPTLHIYTKKIVRNLYNLYKKTFFEMFYLTWKKLEPAGLWHNRGMVKLILVHPDDKILSQLLNVVWIVTQLKNNLYQNIAS